MAAKIFCPRCLSQTDHDAFRCFRCGEPLQQGLRRKGDDGSDRSGVAIAAGYAGLLAVLCFPAPLALLLGIWAVRDLRKHPEKHGMGRAIFGIAMGVLGTVGLVGIVRTIATRN